LRKVGLALNQRDALQVFQAQARLSRRTALKRRQANDSRLQLQASLRTHFAFVRSVERQPAATFVTHKRIDFSGELHNRRRGITFL